MAAVQHGKQTKGSCCLMLYEMNMTSCLLMHCCLVWFVNSNCNNTACRSCNATACRICAAHLHVVLGGHLALHPVFSLEVSPKSFAVMIDTLNQQTTCTPPVHLQDFDRIQEGELSTISRLAAEREDNMMWKEFRERLLRNMGLVRHDGRNLQ
eukprot:GHRR01028258.1.p1 GENE.GHRR01028258.1~~GHRR01028258.1.p1  ORF type:complete len:153 (+),score=37.25 GHRR01028258.1:514-972(+)